MTQRILLIIFSIVVLLSACAGPLDESGGDAGVVGGSVELQGAGASFPFPLYSKWFSEYSKQNPNLRIDYVPIGSGGGIKQITEKTVDFGASDAPMNEEQLSKLKQPIWHIPTVLGAVVVTYNLPGINAEINLSSQALTGIFLGQIKRWNDASITATNPNINLPDQEIAVVHRSDGSGTTAIFVDYLSKISPQWQSQVGKGTSVNWPVGMGGKGNEGVTGQVKQIEGAIGYVELVYALQNNLPYASLQNSAGKFIKPTLTSVTAAAAGSVAKMPADMRISITNADGDTAYPIAAYTYLLIYPEMKNRRKARELNRFIWWAIHDGQQIARDLNYAPLPDEIVKLIEEKLKQTSQTANQLISQSVSQLFSQSANQRKKESLQFNN